MGWGGAVSTNDTPIVNPTQGCLSPRADVPLPVFFLLLVTTIGVVLMLFYWATLLLLVRSAASSLSNERAVNVENNTPNGLVGWMARAVRGDFDQDFQNEDLRTWTFLLNDDGKLMSQRARVGWEY